MARFTCPTCKKVFDSEQTDAMPFCSVRCRLADLHGWFCEEFSIPVDIEKEIERRAEEGISDEEADLSEK
ncbi:MAG: DNA gyrase inhibitor YacG [Thermoguttaceae bacterium]|nr:DNA gyrase inhibitor YacG [Thermoguttaceae bacterium]